MVNESVENETITNRRFRYFQTILRLHWKFLVIILYPLILALGLFIGNDTPVRRCIFVVLLMVGYWITKVFPLAVTALLPIVLFPAFNILEPNRVAERYLSTQCFTYFGTMMICTALEESSLHKRVALRILYVSKCRTRKTHLIICIITSVVSAFYNNIATVFIMSSITKSALGKLEEMGITTIYEKDLDISARESDERVWNDDEYMMLKKTFGKKRRVRKVVARGRMFDVEKTPTKVTICFFLGIAYSTILGGTFFPESSFIQRILNNELHTVFPKHTNINAILWFLATFPLTGALLIVEICWLQFMYLGLLRPNSKDANEVVLGHYSSTRLAQDIKKDIKAMGKMKFAEWVVVIIFTSYFLIMFFKNPGFLKGWHSFKAVEEVHEGTIAICLMFLLFCIPKKLKNNGNGIETILSWKNVEEKVPWNIIILIGSSYAIIEGFSASGLYKATLEMLEVKLRDSSRLIALLVASLFGTLLTQFVSNTICANFVGPIFVALCKVKKMHPYYVTFPTCLCSSFAFLFDFSTPSNAIIASACNLPPLDFFQSGVFLMLFCPIFVLLFYRDYGDVFYNFGKLPGWMED